MLFEVGLTPTRRTRRETQFWKDVVEWMCVRAAVGISAFLISWNVVDIVSPDRVWVSLYRQIFQHVLKICYRCLDGLAVFRLSSFLNVLEMFGSFSMTLRCSALLRTKSWTHVLEKTLQGWCDLGLYFTCSDFLYCVSFSFVSFCSLIFCVLSSVFDVFSKMSPPCKKAQRP